MSQTRRIPRHFVVSSYPNGAPEEETYSNLQTIPDTTEQMEFNISSATQVGHQLALIGDDFDRMYHRKMEDTLLHLARGVAISVFQTWNNIIKSVLRSFGTIWNNNWTKRIVGYGSWVWRLPCSCLCQKLVPAALLLVALWWAVTYGLRG
uniref:BCL2 interacting killer n=1 Tax=Athene cunicularia TaxID=194338 RepID=A0A663MAW9_ATHCN